MAAFGFDSAEVEDYVIVFGRLLPFGFVGMPLIGYLLDHADVRLVFVLINLAALLNNSLLLVPHSRAALLAAICCVAIGRQSRLRAPQARRTAHSPSPSAFSGAYSSFG